MTQARRIEERYRLKELFAFIEKFPKNPRPEKYTFVRKIAKGFNANMQRIYGLLIAGPYNTQFGTFGANAACLATYKATKGKSINWWDDTDPKGPTRPQLDLARDDWGKHFDKIRLWAKRPATREAASKQAEVLWNTLLVAGHSNIQQGFDALLSAAVIGAWTAFEVLAGDLWETALNKQIVLAFIALDAEPSGRDRPDDLENKRKKTVGLLIEKLRDPSFDARTQMGTLLRENREFDFQKRHGAKEAFLKVFPQHKQTIKEIFDAKEIRWLAATRNVLVHKGGIADAEFLNLVGDNQELRGLSGPVIPNGRIINELVRGVVNSATKLLTFVDRWMKNVPASNAQNPQKRQA